MALNKVPIFINSKFGVNTTDNGSSVTYHISPPLEVGTKKCKFRVIQASIWWTFPNISAELDNNTLQILDGGNPLPLLTFEKGLYDLESINANIAQFLINQGYPGDTVQFIGDPSTQKVSAVINSLFHAIDFFTSTLWKVLGFNGNQDIGPGANGQYYEASNVAKLNTVNTILIRSNFTGGVYYNEKTGSNIVASVVPNVSIGNQIIYTPINPIESVVNVHHIDELNIYLTNENGEKLDTNGESFSILGEFIFVD